MDGLLCGCQSCFLKIQVFVSNWFVCICIFIRFFFDYFLTWVNKREENIEKIITFLGQDLFSLLSSILNKVKCDEHKQKLNVTVSYVHSHEKRISTMVF